MLCGISTQKEQKVFAFQVTKVDGPFHCPSCRHELIVKKGKIKVHHFAHKPPFNCSRGQGETEAHRKCKFSIYQQLGQLDNVADLDVEKDFGSVVADVYCKIDNVPVAIEVQRSMLSINDITRRTSEYAKLGVHVIWLALFNKKLNDDKYSPSAWEKWLHATYFGRTYYWVEGLTVLPVHFDKYYSYVEASSWYDEYGDEQYAGGYEKASKRYKKPKFGKMLKLGQDFRPTSRQNWSGGSIYIPSCRLYQDKFKKWW